MTVRIARAVISSAAAFAAALLVAAAVSAHGGETFFVAEPTLVAPGSGLGIRADLLTSGPVRLSLAATDGTRRELGVVEQTEDGHFEVVFEVPNDLPVGNWTLLAEADGVALASATIEVAGTTMDQELGGQGGRDEDDALLVPLPSGWQASRSDAPAATGPAVTDAGAASADLVPFVSLAAAIIALAVLVTRTGTRRPSGP